MRDRGRGRINQIVVSDFDNDVSYDVDPFDDEYSGADDNM